MPETTNVLEKYGFNDFFKGQLSETDRSKYFAARIIAVHKELYTIVREDCTKNAKLKSSIFYRDAYAIFPTVGDFVLVQNNEYGDDLITKVLDRKSKFSRMDFAHSKEQIVAANMDYVFIVSSMNKDLNFKRLERYMTIALASKAKPVIVLTKADVCENYTETELMVKHEFPDTDIVCVSSYTGFGFDKLDKYVAPKTTIALLGSSGVGKSTLINSIAKEDIMKVNGIREEDSKGRHTTTHRQLILTSNGTMFIDTPGMRELGMFNIDEVAEDKFAIIKELATHCKFNNCTHTKEPGCAVLEAIENGTINQAKYDDFMKLYKESNQAKKRAENKLATKSTNMNSNKKREKHRIKY